MWLSFAVTGSAGYIFCKKLQLLKQKLKEWSKVHFGDLELKLDELEDIFVDLYALKNANNGLTETQWEERDAARQEYNKLLV